MHHTHALKRQRGQKYHTIRNSGRYAFASYLALLLSAHHRRVLPIFGEWRVSAE